MKYSETKLNMAYNFAKIKHQNQTRKDGTSYLNHPIMVEQLVEKFFANDNKINELKIAAYLHDTVEDTNTTIEEIKQIFGNYIAFLVNGVTNDNTLKHKLGKTTYLCNKLVNMDEEVLNLKLCDRLANIIDLINAPVDFQDKYSKETITILNYLINNKEITTIQRRIIDNISINIKKLKQNKLVLSKSV